MSPNIITDRRSVKMPTDVMSEAFDAHANVTVSFSGAEDVVLIDMATNLTDEVNVFTLDTGRLHPETYRYIEAVRDFYGIDINVVSPDGARLNR
jgi:phosphoadenosine phosphosulfate reductase